MLLFSCNEDSVELLESNSSVKIISEPCTLEARAAITVEVRGLGIDNPSEVNVKVIDGNYVETLHSSFGFTYSGAYEREGKYTVSIAADGFKDFILQNIEVVSDECHVIGKVLNVNLEKK